MSRERLAAIQLRFLDGEQVTMEDMMYVFGQAERARELGKYNTKLLIQKQRDHIELDELNKQNKRYRKGIEQALFQVGVGTDVFITLAKALEGDPHESS